MEGEGDERGSLAALLRGSCEERADDVAGRLLDRFGSTGDVFSASVEALWSVMPEEDAAVDQIQLVQTALRQALRSRLFQGPLLSNEEALIEYLTFTMAYAATERFRVLFLDARNCPLRDAVIATGCIRGVVIHPREIMRRAMEVGATALILVHNHPSGDAAPSAADIETTRCVAAAAKVMGLHLHDHMIVARSGHSSLKRLGVL